MIDLQQLPKRESLHASDLIGWLPIALSPQGLVWARIPADELREPFFVETAKRLVLQQRTAIRVTGLAPLLEFANFGESLEPTAFVFHVSRCGSTLLSNALRTVASAIVHSEPPAISIAISPYLSTTQGGKPWSTAAIRALRGSVRALAQASPGKHHYFAKLQSADTALMSIFREAWPNTPMLFVYRDPLEVTVANLRDADASYFRFRREPEVGAFLAASTPDEVTSMPPEEYSARVLGAFYRTAHEMLGQNTLLLHYPDIDPEAVKRFLARLGIQPSADEMSRIEKVIGTNAKNPALGKFVPDAREKRAAADAKVSEAVTRFALSDYRKLLERTDAVV